MRGLRSIAAFAVVCLLGSMVLATPGGAADLSVTVTPATDLVDGQVVHVTVSGGSPDSFSSSQVCAAGGGNNGCSQSSNGAGTLDPQGALSVDMTLDAQFALFDGSVVDCRVAPGCVLDTEIYSVDDSSSQAISTPLTFRADGPLLPPPTITATPSTDLVDGTTVHVIGSGFAAGSQVQLVSCRSPFTKYQDCESPRTYSQAGSDGTLAAGVYLPAILSTNDGQQVDCRTTACELVATREVYIFEPRHTASVPLAFVPDGPLRPPPTLTVTPSDGLVDGQQVQVAGSGFRPGPLLVSQCTRDTGDGVSVFQRCAGSGYVEADENGNVAEALNVAVLERTSAGFSDCRTDPGCSIEALDFNGGSALASVPIAFDPGGPEPTFPTLTVAPGGPLAARSGAIVSGSGFGPYAGLSLEQCRIENGLPQECSGSGSDYVVTDAQGAFLAGTVLTAVIAGPDGTEIDCRTVTCAVVADPYEGYPGVGALDFGRPVPPRGRYLSPVFDNVDLTEGIVYRSTTNSHGDPVDLKLDVYQPAGDTAPLRPAVMWMFGGYFGSGDRVQLREMAQAMARRGYVAISIDYRTRPEIFSSAPGCIPVGGTCLDPTQFSLAITDARDDARAAMVWLHDHAAEYRIDPRAISSAGWSAGAITSLGLAHDGTGDRAATSIPAAAVSLAGIVTGIPQAGDPPTLMMGGNQDSLLPLGAQIAGCGSIVAAGSSCDFVAYAGQRPAPAADSCIVWNVAQCTYVLGRDAEHGWFFSERPDVIDHISTFLADKVLRPVGLLAGGTDHGHHHPRHHHHRHHDGNH